ncbi:hypothetical protein KUTG_10012 [Kutzneria sp. 744]|nr:hypothetical protein KUTG_10012 [Kutzneria sp. 744]
MWLYQPFPEQTERWSHDWRAHHDRVRSTAARVAVLGRTYSPKTLHERNSWMLRDAQALVCVSDPEHRGGGTHATLQQARSRRMPVIHIDVRRRDTRLVLPHDS